MSVLHEVLSKFLDGPKILGFRRSSDWDVKHQKTQIYKSDARAFNGKKYDVVWIFPQTHKKIVVGGFLESVDGGTLHQLSDKGKKELEGKTNDNPTNTKNN